MRAQLVTAAGGSGILTPAVIGMPGNKLVTPCLCRRSVVRRAEVVSAMEHRAADPHSLRLLAADP